MEVPKKRPPRKSVSFSQQDNIFLIETVDEIQKDEEQEETDSAVEILDSNKMLIPTFVPPIRKPTFAKEFRQKVLILEDIEVCDDLTLIGKILMNVSLLKKLQTEEQVKD